MGPSSLTTNISLSDAHVALYGVGQLALVIGVGIVVYVLHKKGTFPAKLKNLIWLVVGIWSLAIVLQYAISVYNYIHTLRPLQQQVQRQEIGR